VCEWPPCLNQGYALHSYVDLCSVHGFGLPMPMPDGAVPLC